MKRLLRDFLVSVAAGLFLLVATALQTLGFWTFSIPVWVCYLTSLIIFVGTYAIMAKKQATRDAEHSREVQHLKNELAKARKEEAESQVKLSKLKSDQAYTEFVDSIPDNDFTVPHVDF